VKEVKKMIAERIAELKRELALYEAIHDDYVVAAYCVRHLSTDAVFRAFCQRHLDVNTDQVTFTRIMCKEFNLKSVQGSLDGVRGYFYD
jgi:hypothetical protein